MSRAYGDALLQKTAVPSFWNSFLGYPDPFAGLVEVKQSTQKTDTYARLGSAPMPTEWVGDRNRKDVNEYSYTVTNKNYDSTIEIDKDLLRYQQWDEVASVAANQGQKAAAHRVKLLTDALDAGESTACEDGQFFFDDDHADPGAEYTTSQDNDLTAQITDADAPTDLEMATAIRSMFDAAVGFKDDRGDPFFPASENPADWILMLPTNLRSVGMRVWKNDSLTGPLGNDVKGTFTPRINPFMATSTTQVVMYLMFAGGPHKPLILQEAGGNEFIAYVDDDSGNGVYSVSWAGREAYGNWRTAIRYEFTQP